MAQDQRTTELEGRLGYLLAGRKVERCTHLRQGPSIVMGRVEACAGSTEPRGGTMTEHRTCLRHVSVSGGHCPGCSRV